MPITKGQPGFVPPRAANMEQMPWVTGGAAPPPTGQPRPSYPRSIGGPGWGGGGAVNIPEMNQPRPQYPRSIGTGGPWQSPWTANPSQDQRLGAGPGTGTPMGVGQPRPQYPQQLPPQQPWGGDQQMYAGGSQNFNEMSGSYNPQMNQQFGAGPGSGQAIGFGGGQNQRQAIMQLLMQYFGGQGFKLMPVETWQAYQPPKENLERKSGQQIAHGDNIALLHTIGGDPSAKGTPVNAGADGASPAGRYNSTAPYKPSAPPGTKRPRTADRAKRCRANDDTCGAWATASGYCYGHTKSLSRDLFGDG